MASTCFRLHRAHRLPPGLHLAPPMLLLLLLLSPSVTVVVVRAAGGIVASTSDVVSSSESDSTRALQVSPSTSLSSPSLWWRMFSAVGASLRGAIHLVGSIIPLRGLASFAADVGLPGAATIKDILTPNTRVQSFI